MDSQSFWRATAGNGARSLMSVRVTGQRRGATR